LIDTMLLLKKPGPLVHGVARTPFGPTHDEYVRRLRSDASIKEKTADGATTRRFFNYKHY
jgi:hypothetical protein